LIVAPLAFYRGTSVVASLTFYRGTSLIRNTLLLGPCSSPRPMAIIGCWVFLMSEVPHVGVTVEG
jgi:hypothetical protein